MNPHNNPLLRLKLDAKPRPRFLSIPDSRIVDDMAGGFLSFMDAQRYHQTCFSDKFTAISRNKINSFQVTNSKLNRSTTSQFNSRSRRLSTQPVTCTQFYDRKSRLDHSITRYDASFNTTGTFERTYSSEHQIVVNKLVMNRENLGTLSQKLTKKRKTEYDDYINNSLRYSKLLELNNNRSKILTSLNSKLVGEVKVIVTQTTDLADVYYEVIQKKLEIRGWKPATREGQTCTVFKDTLYLLGGHSNMLHKNISFFDFKESVWSKDMEGDINRTYHSTLLYKNSFIIMFGGMSNYNTYYKTRECLNSTALFNINSLQSKKVKIADQESVEPRRSHGACIAGKLMFVFGGMNTRRDYLNDLWYLDLKQLKWVKNQYVTDSTQTEEFLKHGIAKHCLIPFYSPESDISKLATMSTQDGETDRDGIYVFGGNNQIGTENILVKINPHKRPCMIQKIQAKGIKPSGVQPCVLRHNQNIIVILSGERDKRELRLFLLKQREFVKVRNHDQLQGLGGVGSSLVKHDEAYYIFFGLGEKGYVGNLSSFTIKQHVVEKAKKRKAVVTNVNKVVFFDSEQQEDGP